MDVSYLWPIDEIREITSLYFFLLRLGCTDSRRLGRIRFLDAHLFQFIVLLCLGRHKRSRIREGIHEAYTIVQINELSPGNCYFIYLPNHQERKS